MKRLDNKSLCPINFGLEHFGDLWSLLIIRDIVYFGKKTYGEFLESDEHISTNILARRLKELEQKGILQKKPNPQDKRTDFYVLTEKGLRLIPLMVEISLWSVDYIQGIEDQIPPGWLEALAHDKSRTLRLIQDTVRSGGAVFVGPDNAYGKLR